jgi:hypothetical protein
MKYQGHVNVEVCSSVKSVKYIYKYIHKGHDAAIIKIINEGNRTVNIDEIKAYQETRFVSAVEAIYNMFEYKLDEMSHSVMRLPVHEENEHLVFYNADSELSDELLERRSKSPLLGFFQLNSKDDFSRSLTFPEIPLHYKWDNGQWIKRKKKINLHF